MNCKIGDSIVSLNGYGIVFGTIKEIKAKTIAVQEKYYLSPKQNPEYWHIASPESLKDLQEIERKIRELIDERHRIVYSLPEVKIKDE